MFPWVTANNVEQQERKADLDYVTGALATKANLSGATFTGGIQATAGLFAGDNTIDLTTVSVDGVDYSTWLQASDLGSANLASLILNRHSTTSGPLILGSRSNSATATEGAVTAGQSLLQLLAVGYVGTDHQAFGLMDFTVGTGTVSDTSSPGKWTLKLTPDGSTVPVDVMSIDSDASVTFAGSLSFSGFSIGGVNLNSTDLTSPGATLVGIPSTTATYDNLHDFLNITTHRGVVSGCTISDGGAGTINVSSGYVITRVSNSELANLVVFAYAGDTGAALTDGVENYIYVDYAAGTPVLDVTTSRTYEYDRVLIGQVLRDGTHVHITPNKVPTADAARLLDRALEEVWGLQHATGGVVGETGTRNITTTNGVFWIGATRITTTGIDTSGLGTFDYYYRDGLGGWTKVASQTQISNTQYDNGSGTLASLTTNRYGVHWVFVELDGEVAVVYGQGNYTLSQAEAAAVPSSLPGHLATSHATLAAKIIIQISASSFTSLETAYGNATIGFTPVSDHGDLAGLSDDDHTQYLLADGTRSANPYLNILSETTSTTRGLQIDQYNTGTHAPLLILRKARGSYASPSAVQTSDTLGSFGVQGYGGTAMSTATPARIAMFAESTFTDSSHNTYMAFATTPSASTTNVEQLRITGSGNIAMKAAAKFYFDGVAATGDTYITESSANVLDFYAGANRTFSIGSTTAAFGTAPNTAYGVYLANQLNSTRSTAIYNDGVVQSSLAAGSAFGYANTMATAVAGFILTSYYSFIAQATALGAGSSVTNGIGFIVSSNFGGKATNTYGFYGALASASNTYNLYMAGTAPNYLAGALSIGTTSTSSAKVHIRQDSSGATSDILLLQNATSSVINTGVAMYFDTNGNALARAASIASIQSTAGNYADLRFSTAAGDVPVESFRITASHDLAMIAAKKFYFDGVAATGDTYITESSANVLDVYAGGTKQLSLAAGYMAIGGASVNSAYRIQLGGSWTGNPTMYGFSAVGTVQSDVTANVIGFHTGITTASTLNNLYHMQTNGATISSGSVTTQIGYHVSSSMTTATNNYGFYGQIASGTGRWNLYMAGTAQNYLAGVTGIGIAASSTTWLALAASTTSVSSLRVPHGSAPTSPVDGDIWTTTAGIYVRINGSTVGPLT